MTASSDTHSTPYEAPLKDLILALDVVGLADILQLGHFHHVDRETVLLALDEFGRLASKDIAGTDRIGDVVGAQIDRPSASVETPVAFHDAYQRYVSGGWGSLAYPQEYGGGDLPSVISLALQEMFASANMALSLNPVLTQGAIDALLHWGSTEQKGRFLPRLLTGEWTGTMNLTEPGAGSDLGEIQTMAEPRGDGLWLISGTKIFITWGEHDLADNIVHLVLARTPQAPLGTKGLSLFIVPKFTESTVDPGGTRNSLRCISLEEKLGIHGSPTCVMSFERAEGELVGDLHGGMRAMFTMMNAARLSIGVQGPAVGERAYQHALRYSLERLQGRSSGATNGPSPIVEHPDVQRMLLSMSTTNQASRLVLFWVGAQVDQARHGSSPLDRERAQAMVDLVTPVAKAWATDCGFATTSLGIQVLGGAGYIEESGMAQRLRDSRIAPIYEGTNGIQAIDLVARKLNRSDGAWVRSLLDEIASSIPTAVDTTDPLQPSYTHLLEALGTLRESTEWMLARFSSHRNDVLAGASSYLELFGLTMGGWLMVKRAEFSRSQSSKNGSRTVAECNFFALEFLSRAVGLAQPIRAGASRLEALSAIE